MLASSQSLFGRGARVFRADMQGFRVPMADGTPGAITQCFDDPEQARINMFNIFGLRRIRRIISPHEYMLGTYKKHCISNTPFFFPFFFLGVNSGPASFDLATSQSSVVRSAN